MAENLISGVVTVILAIIGVAIIAVLVSQKAQTPQVLGAAGGFVSSTLGAALSPVNAAGGLGFGGGFSGPTGSIY